MKFHMSSEELQIEFLYLLILILSSRPMRIYQRKILSFEIIIEDRLMSNTKEREREILLATSAPSSSSFFSRREMTNR